MCCRRDCAVTESNVILCRKADNRAKVKQTKRFGERRFDLLENERECRERAIKCGRGEYFSPSISKCTQEIWACLVIPRYPIDNDGKLRQPFNTPHLKPTDSPLSHRSMREIGRYHHQLDETSAVIQQHITSL